MVLTIILNLYFLLNVGCQFNHAIEKHKKRSVGLGWCEIELRVN